MKNVKYKLSNNVVTITCIVVASAYLAFFTLLHFNLKPPESVNYLLATITLPITAIGINLMGLNSIKKNKDVSSSERRRLLYIVDKKYKALIKCISFYVIISVGIGIVSTFSKQMQMNIFTTSFLLGVIVASLYSLIVSYFDNKKLSDFEALLQEKANIKAANAQFQGKK